MTNTLLNFAIFWGVWLLVPMLIDGLTYVVYLAGVWRAAFRYRARARKEDAPFFPYLVTIIIPVYNGQHSLGPCLESIRKQSYPQECIQVVVANNQSTDESFDVFTREQAKSFGGTVTWLDLAQKGKVYALNAGIHVALGTLIVNIDCDTVLHPDAIRNVARTFYLEPDLAAATGVIEVLPADRAKLPPWRVIWAECEALEYLTAFRIGRQYQTSTNSLFTLAGAFSAFRREVLLNTFLYDNTTVSEDTKLTHEVHQQAQHRNMRIACVSSAIAYVEPTLSTSRLYAQRVRWQRGELEVAALQASLKARDMLRVRGVSMSRTLMIDHTLAFPRMVWTFLMPMLYFLGYPLPLVVSATVGMYVFYAVIEALSMLTCYALSTSEERQRLRQGWYIWAIMPSYRFILFWFRFGGFLSVLTDTAQWRVAAPWEETAEAFQQVADKSRRAVSRISSRLGRPRRKAASPRSD